MSGIGGMTVGLAKSHGSSWGIASRLGTGILYPSHYFWYIFAATLDVLMTHTILYRFGGSELNHIADALIDRYGVAGMVGLKYASIVLVVAICEFVGRRRIKLGRRLAVAAISLSAMPVGVGMMAVWEWTHAPETPAYIIESPSGELATLPLTRTGALRPATTVPAVTDDRPVYSW